MALTALAAQANYTMASYSTMNTVPAADVESETPLLSRDIKVNAKTLIGGAAAAAFALGALAATAVASAPQPAPAALYTAPRAPAAFYSAPHRAPAAFAAHSSHNLQFKLDGSEGKTGKCLGVQDHNNVRDGTELIMWDCVDNAVGQEFTFDGDRLMYDGKCATWSNTGVTLESCSSDENQDIEVMFNKQYTHNIKFTGFGDYCLTGHSGPDAKDRVVYGETCDHLKQHWDIIKL